MDTVDRRTRSRIMASVGQRDTGPEMRLRRALHRLGYDIAYTTESCLDRQTSSFPGSGQRCSCTGVSGISTRGANSLPSQHRERTSGARNSRRIGSVTERTTIPSWSADGEFWSFGNVRSKARKMRNSRNWVHTCGHGYCPKRDSESSVIRIWCRFMTWR